MSFETFYRECENAQGVTKAFGLEELVEDFINETDIEGQIDSALGIINSTYDDVVNKFDFDDYNQKLDSIPDVSNVNNLVQNVNGTITDLSLALGNAANFLPNSTELNSIMAQLTSLESAVFDIESDVTNVVNNVEEIDLEPVKTSISSLEANLKSPTSSIKNDVYTEASFIRANTLAFIDQLASSLINKFGSCQVTFCG